MSVGELLLFGNVSQPPFCNNLYPPLRAFQKLFRTTLIEPSSLPGFVSTGGARPALIPDDSVFSHTDPPPQAVVCLGGALHLSARARRMFPSDTIFGGFALSDPQGLEASLAIAPEFDLFYTQDAQTLPAYAARGIAARKVLHEHRSNARFPLIFPAEAIQTILEAYDRTEAPEAPRRTALRECMERLPARTREVLTLRYEQDLSGEGIATRLGSSVESVHQTLSRARTALGDCIRQRLALRVVK